MRRIAKAVPPLGECLQVLEVTANQIWPVAEVVGPKAIFDQVMWLARLDVRQDMTEEKGGLWELGGQEDSEDEVREEDMMKWSGWWKGLQKS